MKLDHFFRAAFQYVAKGVGAVAGLQCLRAEAGSRNGATRIQVVLPRERHIASGAANSTHEVAALHKQLLGAVVRARPE